MYRCLILTLLLSLVVPPRGLAQTPQRIAGHSLDQYAQQLNNPERVIRLRSQILGPVRRSGWPCFAAGTRSPRRRGPLHCRSQPGAHRQRGFNHSQTAIASTCRRRIVTRRSLGGFVCTLSRGRSRSASDAADRSARPSRAWYRLQRRRVDRPDRPPGCARHWAADGGGRSKSAGQTRRRLSPGRRSEKRAS